MDEKIDIMEVPHGLKFAVECLIKEYQAAIDEGAGEEAAIQAVEWTYFDLAEPSEVMNLGDDCGE